ncbi:MAG: hypothetical protein L6Q99_06715 [Planctomycetes bacterium]|nr:hypothetical protein [Planctomycetota bacterium]
MKDAARQRLAMRVLAALRAVVGRRLSGLSFGLLRVGGTLESADLSRGDVCFGGELILAFGEGASVHVTWDENAGWEHHFSVQARSTSAFRADALAAVDASRVAPWSGYVGSVLERAHVLGLDGVPHVLELEFEDAALWVGDGHRGEWGDGDDLVVVTERPQTLGARLERLVVVESREK